MTSPPNQEIALASELLEIASETELHRLLPRLIRPALAGLTPVGALVMKAAAPVLRKAVARALPLIRKASPRRRAATAAGAKGGGLPATRPINVRPGAGGPARPPREAQITASLQLVRAARQAARRAAIAALQQVQLGRPVTYDGLRRVVYRALVGAVRERAPSLLPAMGASRSAQARGYTGSPLPAVPPGRLAGAPGAVPARQSPGYTGRVLPAARGRMLGTPRSRAAAGAKRCQACKHERCQACKHERASLG